MKGVGPIQLIVMFAITLLVLSFFGEAIIGVATLFIASLQSVVAQIATVVGSIFGGMPG